MIEKYFLNRWVICYAAYSPAGRISVYPKFFDEGNKLIEIRGSNEDLMKGTIVLDRAISKKQTLLSPILDVKFKNIRKKNLFNQISIGEVSVENVKLHDRSRYCTCVEVKDIGIQELLEKKNISRGFPYFPSFISSSLFFLCKDGLVGPFDYQTKKDDSCLAILNGTPAYSYRVSTRGLGGLRFFNIVEAENWGISLTPFEELSNSPVIYSQVCIADNLLKNIFVRCLSMYNFPIAVNIRAIKNCLNQIIENEELFNSVPDNQERILALLNKVEQYSDLLASLRKFMLSRPGLSAEVVKTIRETYPHFLDSLLIAAKQEPLPTIEDYTDGASEVEKKQLEKEIHALEQVKAEKEKEVGEVANKVQAVIQSHIALLQTKINEYKTVAGGFATQVDQELLTRIQNLVSSVTIAHALQEDANIQEAAEDTFSCSESLPVLQFSHGLQDVSLGKEIIKRVRGYLVAKKRVFAAADIANFLICLTQGFMTTFAGNPGSGKTSLCNLLGAALGLVAEHDGKHFVDVPVSRGWTSAKDFIGYYNPLAKQMVRSNAAVYKALELSEQEDSGEVPPMVILLDEANLSPLEHYWSSFLKNSDFSSSSARSFSLGGDKVWKINPHLRFLATVNHDHTTEELSPRFLDRSWVILLDGQSSEVDARDINIPDISGEWAAIPYAKLEEAFGVTAHAKLMMKPEVLQLWKAIRAAMQESQMRIMPRNVNMVENYVKTASLYMSDTFMPLDYAMAQKILPTLSGSGERMKTCLTELRRKCDGKLPRTASLLARMLEAGKHNMEMYQFFVS